MDVIKAEKYYHIFNHANGFENLFMNNENYRYFLQQWIKYISPIADTYCYCLMPNHLHFLIKTKSKEEIINFKRSLNPEVFCELNPEGFQNLPGLINVRKNLPDLDANKIISQQFSNLFNSYTKAFNKRYNRRGSLFEPNFKRKIIEDETYLIHLIYYIHRNPAHHGFCSDFRDWKHSSFHRLVSDNPGFINQQLVFEYFSDKQNFIDSHENKISLNEEYNLE